jgi:hypothetical protein
MSKIKVIIETESQRRLIRAPGRQSVLRPLAYTPEEIIMVVGCSEWVVYKALSSGDLPVIKNGNQVLVLADHLIKWLETWEVGRDEEML